MMRLILIKINKNKSNMIFLFYRQDIPRGFAFCAGLVYRN